MRRILHLFPILGTRAALTFALVTFLAAALLATINITSRYALKRYVEDQLQRIPWDVAVYQRGSVRDAGAELRGRLAQLREISRVENLVFLRARFPEGADVVSEVGGQALTAPWLCLLAASDLSILPPALSMPVARNIAAGADPQADSAVLALVGPERAMGNAFLSLQGAREFSFRINVPQHERVLFSTPLRGVVRADRDELNRWLMDQTGSLSYVPHVGVILLMPYHAGALTQFDRAASGLLSVEIHGQDQVDEGHVQTAEYEPELVYLSRLDRASLISGWDIEGSLDRITHALASINRATRATLDRAASRAPRYELRLAHEEPGGDEEDRLIDHSFTVDSTTFVLLARMQRIARLIGAVTLLVALPLLWMAWVLAANLVRLLMLNERRTLGLLRLRGVPAVLLRRTLLLAVIGGGLAGGITGLAAGAVLPLVAYEGARAPFGLLLERRELTLSIGFLVVSLALAFAIGQRLLRYATSISPVEASRRVAASEAASGGIRFGIPEAFALAAGTYVLVFGWILNTTASSRFPVAWVVWTDRTLGFVGLPLFLYGLTMLLASRRRWMQALMAPVLRPVAGAIGSVAIRHLAAKPHRTAAFLMVVALMGSVSLYPTIASRSFEDKALRGARVQLGSEWQLLFNAPDLVSASQLRGGMGQQVAALRPAIDRLTASLEAVPGVRGSTFLIECVLPSFYLPGYGLRGVPLFLIGDPDTYLRQVYSEPEIGVSAPFRTLVEGVRQGSVVVSPSVADFWQITPGAPVLLGSDAQRTALTPFAAGTVAFLPGIPPKTVTDRQTYAQARVDYVNYLFSSQAYTVASAGDPQLANLQLLVSRVIVLVRADPRAGDGLGPAMARAAPTPPLEMHRLEEEVSKIGSDMFVSLALANMRIYLIGGLLLAGIAILAVALANYTEDRRTLALLRIRGATPAQTWRFVFALLIAPAVLGLLIGGLAAILAGYGLANYVWRLRDIKTVVQLLPTHLVPSSATAAVLATIISLLLALSTVFSWWLFRRTAHQRLSEL